MTESQREALVPYASTYLYRRTASLLSTPQTGGYQRGRLGYGNLKRILVNFRIKTVGGREI